jgi:hypothetical protein
MVATPRQEKCVEMIGCSLAHLFRHNSPVFDGSERPMAADD